MWKCESCKKKFSEDVAAIEVKFGYIDSKEAKQKGQYMAFYTESAWSPLCERCAVAYIKGR